VLDEPLFERPDFSTKTPISASLERLRRDRRERPKISPNAPTKGYESSIARDRAVSTLAAIFQPRRTGATTPKSINKM
jgi:hypothetical protein